MAGELWALSVGVAVVVAGRLAGRWAQERCDAALAGARLIPAPSERSFALVAGLEGRSRDRAQAREQRAFQQALDTERRDGAFLARRAIPTVPPGR